MEPQRMGQVRKVRIMYITDPGSDKPRPVYVAPTSQPNTYQILSTPVIVTSASDGQIRYVNSNEPITTSTTTTTTVPQQMFPTTSTTTVPMIPSTSTQQPQQHQTFVSRPPILQQPQVQQQPSTARRALIPPQRRFVHPQPPQQPRHQQPRQQQPQQQQPRPQRPLIRFPKLKLPAPFDYPEIKNFVSSRILPKLSPDFIDDFFKDLNGIPPIVEKDRNVETIKCSTVASMQPSTTQPEPKPTSASSTSLKYIPPIQHNSIESIRKPSEQRKAPMIMRRAVQNNRQRLTAAAPYTLSKENRQVRIINPVNPVNSAPKIRPAIIRNVKPVKPQLKIPQQNDNQQQQPSPSNVPLQVQNPSKS